MLDMPATIQQAIAMLGPHKVARGPKGAMIEHTDVELKECGIANAYGQSDWHFVWCAGISFYSQCMMRGVSRTAQPCFYKNHADKLIKPGEYPWAASVGESGYYLIDFAGRWRDMDWYAQEDAIARLGNKFLVRAPSLIVTEAAFAIFDAHGGRPLFGWKHYGPLEDVEEGEDSMCLGVGFFDTDGWCVEECDPTEQSEDYRVCVMRTPELRKGR